MNKKKLFTIIGAALLVCAIGVALFFLMRGDTEPPLDSDGDGIPDSEDNEDTDNLDNDYQVNVDDFFK